MTQRPIKLEKVDAELQGARQKLDGALQFLVDKAEETSSSSDESLKNLDISVKPEDLANLAEVMTPLRRTIRRPGRKRKSKEDYSLKNSYILKLFDRSVDLASFAPDTPLYPVCRAWIRNKPRNRSPSSSSAFRSRSPSPSHIDHEVEDITNEDGSSEPNKCIYHLPPPTSATKKNNTKSPRIPSPIPKEKEELIVISEGDAPSHETLLSKHIVRWRQVRQKWKDTAAMNEERYRDNTNMLKTMFDNAFPKEELPDASEPWSLA